MPAALAAIAVQGIFDSAIAGAVAGFVVGSVQQSRAQRKAERDAINRYNASLRDQKTIIRSPLAPRNIVFGQDRASGPLWPWFTWGDKRQYHTFGVTLAGHECDGIVTHYFNADALTLDGNGWVTTAKYCRSRTVSASEIVTFDGSGLGTLSNVPFGQSGASATVTYTVPPDVQYTYGLEFDGASTTVRSPVANITGQVNYSYRVTEPLFRIWTYLGGAGQAASPELIAAAAAAGVPGEWGADRLNTGVCYSVIQMEADYDVLGQIGVPNYSADLRGVKAYDTRTASTAHNSNPAVLARWFMLSGYAPKTVAADINTTELEASANVCDESVAFSASRTEARYTCNGQIFCDKSPLENLNLILDSMDGDAVYVGGQWLLIAGYHRTASLTLAEDALSDAAIKLAPSIPKDRRFNLVTGTFVDRSRGFTRTSYQAVTSSVYQAQDGGEVLPQQVDLDLVNDDVRCQMIAWQRLARHRQQMTVTLGFNTKAYDTFPLNTVALSAARFGWSGQLFRVMRREYTGATLNFVLQKADAATWAWDYTQAGAAVVSPNTSLPDPITVPDVQSLTAASGTDALLALENSIQSRIRLSWAPFENQYVTNGGRVEIRYRLYGTETWSNGEPAAGSTTEAYIGSVEDRQWYELQARAVNNVNRAGVWVPIFHQVVGQTERPEPYDFLNVIASNGFAIATWPLHPAADVRAGGTAVIRHSPLTTGVTWEAGYILESFPGRSVQGAVPLITGTYMIKAQDYAGNWSEGFTSFVATEGMVTGFSTVATSTQDTGFAGTKTGLIATDGILKLDSNTLVDDMTALIDDWGYIDGLGGIASSGTYLFDTYVDCTTTAVRRAEADLKVLAFDTDDRIDSRTLPIDEWDAVDGAEINDCDVTLYAATTNDNPAGTPVWGEWTEFFVADFNCRALKFKAEISSGFPTHNIQIEQLRVHVKVAV